MHIFFKRNYCDITLEYVTLHMYISVFYEFIFKTKQERSRRKYEYPPKKFSESIYFFYKLIIIIYYI